MEHRTEPESRASSDDGRDASGNRILRMTPDGATGLTADAAIHQRLDALAQAIRDKDLDRLMSFYSRDVEVFDVRASLNVPGAAAYRNNLEHWFDSFEGPLGFELHNVRVVTGDSTGFCHYLGLVVGARSAHHRTGYWVRGTTCFERCDGEWLVTHVHLSLPAPTGSAS